MLATLSALWTLTAGCGGGGEIDVEEADVRVMGIDGVDAEGLRGCVDESGGVHLVWSDDRDGEAAIWHARSGDGGGSWTEQQVSDDGPASRPDLACVGDRIYVAWEDLRDTAVAQSNIYIDRSLDGGLSWGADVALDGDPFGEHMSRGPRVAAAGSSVHVAWYDGRSGAFDIYLQTSTDGAEVWLNDPVRVDSDGAGEAWSGGPLVATDGAGAVVVAWEELRGGSPAVAVNASTDFGRTFPYDDTLLSDAPAGEASAPALAMLDQRARLAWQVQGADGLRQVHSAVSDDGGQSWSDTEVISPVGSDAFGPALAGDGDATIHAAWQDDRSVNYDIFHMPDAGGWGAEQRVDADFEGSAISVEVSLAAWEDGQLVAVWEDRRSDDAGLGFNDLYYAWSDDGGATWSEADFRVNGNAPGSSWCVDAWVGRSPDGEALYFAWRDGRYGSSDIFFNALAPGEESAWDPPEG